MISYNRQPTTYSFIGLVNSESYKFLFKSMLLLLLIVKFNPLMPQQTQLSKWLIHDKLIDFTNNFSQTTLPITNREGATNSMYNSDGDLLFYVQDGTVFEKNGTIIGNCNFTGNGNTKETLIVPVPGSCLDYYIIYSTLGIYNSSTKIARVAYSKISQDPISKIWTLTNNNNALGGFNDNVNILDCSFAVSTDINNNQQKYLYIVAGNNLGNSNYYGYLKRYLITESGIINPILLLESTNSNQQYDYQTFEVELSHNGTLLVWANILGPGKLYTYNIQTNIVNQYNISSNFPHGVEFSIDNSKVLFTNYGGNIRYLELSDGSIHDILNTSTAHTTHIETGFDGLIYANHGFNCIALDPQNLTVINTTSLFSTSIMFGGHLYSFVPKQIDGYNYYNKQQLKNCCVQNYPYTNQQPGTGLTSSAIWTPANNPFQTGQSTISLKEGFSIGPGMVLEIEDMTIEFGHDAYIEITEGGKMVLDNTTIKALPTCYNSWKGILVQGDMSLVQNEQNQGVLEMINGSSIQNANVGIYVGQNQLSGLFGGGIIKIQESTFLNNQIDIWMRPYGASIAIPTGTGIIPQESYIKNNVFNTDANMANIQDKYYNLLLWGIHGLDILGNDFIHSNPPSNIDERGIGIMSSGSSFNLEPLGNDKNTFKDLYYGVRAFDGTYNLEIVKIKNNTFDDCYRSIFLSGTNNAEVSLNDIWVPLSSQDATFDQESYAVYLYGGSGFKIEENNIDCHSTYIQHSWDYIRRGIIVHNTGAVNNEIYNNTFHNMPYGNQSQCFNTGESTDLDVGLKYLCNKNHGTYPPAINVLGYSYCSPGEFQFSAIGVGALWPRIGIAPNQKLPSISHNDYPAANTFISSISTSFYTDINAYEVMDYNNYLGNSIRYYWQNLDISNARYDAQVSPSNVIPIQTNIPNLTYDAACPSKVSKGTLLSYNDLQAELNTAQIAYNSSVLIYNIWKDGGNTNLGEEVQTTSTWDAYLQFNDLLGQSPYLSEEVLIEVVNNSVFTSLMVKLIMVANPHASRRTAVLEALETRIPAMPQSYIDEIRAEESTISQLELLRDDVSSCYHLICSLKDELKRKYKEDETNSLVKDSLISIISSNNEINSRYELALAYLSYGMFTETQTTMITISNDFELSGPMLSDHNHMQNMIGIIQENQPNQSFEGCLSETQREDLEEILEENHPLTSPIALELLMLNNPMYVFSEPVYQNPENSARKPKSEVRESIETSQAFKLFPNPAMDYSTLSYDCSMPDLNYRIYNTKGLQFLNGMLESMQEKAFNEVFINTDCLAPGVYQCCVYSIDLLVWTGKLTIVK